MAVQKTTDYSLFKTIKGNREVTMGHILRLKRNIEKHNMLADQPILVNSKMEVIDGQHRLEAAKQLGVPIFWKQGDAEDIRDTQLLNSATRPWASQDYLNSYISAGNKHYKELQEFVNHYHLPISFSAALLSGTVSLRGPFYDKFKSGDFVVEDRDFAKDIAEKVVALRRYCEESVPSDRDFIRAVETMWEHMDQEQIVDMLSLWGKKVTRRATTIDYLRQFEDIYKDVYKKVVRFY